MIDDLRFGVSKKGMVILAGLSPEETFELEELLFQDGTASESRLRELLARHRRMAEEPTSERRGYSLNKGADHDR